MISVTEQSFLASPREMLERMHSANEILDVVSGNGGYVLIDAPEEPLEDAVPCKEIICPD